VLVRPPCRENRGQGISMYVLHGLAQAYRKIIHSRFENYYFKHSYNINIKRDYMSIKQSNY